MEEKKRGRERIKAFISLSSWEGHFSYRKYYFQNHNDKNVQKWVSNMGFKFYDYPTVDKSGIVVLLGQTKDIILKISTVRKWAPNLVFKFHDDPTINELGIVILLR